MKNYIGPKDISIISSNCIGGEICYDCGLKFNTPVINLWMKQPDYLKFVLDLDYYLECQLNFSDELTKQYSYPVAFLGGENRKIILYFLHYSNKKEAENDWNRRKNRINKDKICLIMSDRDGITYEDMLKFGKIECYRKILFTYKDYPELSFAYKLKQDKDNPYVQNYQMKTWNGFWRWEFQWNCVKWLNGENDK